MATPRTAGGAGKDNPWPARLKAIRRRLGITQTEAAQRVGVVLRTWQNWEYGRRRPSASAAHSIVTTFPDPR